MNVRNKCLAEIQTGEFEPGRKRSSFIEASKTDTLTTELNRNLPNAVVRYRFYTGKVCSKAGVISRFKSPLESRRILTRAKDGL